ncbi:MAG: DUF1353 domain-containing protein [Salipiger marinus]|uniref:DUF1353 domain-containing protein n=1 Tax=Salipiger marinus TaxID=555512 RepID=UPI004059F584
MTKRFLASALCVPLIAACAAPTQRDVDRVNALYDINCSVRPADCIYENPPVVVRNEPVDLPRRPYRFFPLARPLNFTDAQQRDWVAPAGTLTDGASIPPIFVAIVGSPTAPEYVNAGAVHDAYCGVGNEAGPNYHSAEWRDVHRMFFDALVAGGTPPSRAKVMFAAVWLGGPRWRVVYDLEPVPVPARQAAMRQAKDYIEREDPPMSDLIPYLERLERGLLRRYAALFPHLDSGDDPEPESSDYPSPQPEPEPEPEPEGPSTTEPDAGDQSTADGGGGFVSVDPDPITTEPVYSGGYR